MMIRRDSHDDYNSEIDIYVEMKVWFGIANDCDDNER
jgi:hypothetical protein